MRINGWLLVALLVAAVVVGAGGIVGSVAFNRHTSTDAFCTSCHAMALQADDPYYQHSAHFANAEGVRASCADCHIPTTNWFVETYTHVSSGTRDVFANFTHNFNDPKVWAAHRTEMAKQVRAQMHAQDSITCRDCHEADAIHPTSDAGRAAHAMLHQGKVTCVDCHSNLVHPEAEPTAETN